MVFFSPASDPNMLSKVLFAFSDQHCKIRNQCTHSKHRKQVSVVASIIENSSSQPFSKFRYTVKNFSEKNEVFASTDDFEVDGVQKKQ